LIIMHPTSDVIEGTPFTPFVEKAGLLFGEKAGKTWTCHLQHLSSGSAVRVEFDWKTVFEHETKRGNVLGFFHTHPSGMTKPSRRDIRTMRAWCDCLGKPLLCMIGVPDVRDGALYAYLFTNHRSFGRRARVVAQDEQNFIIKV